MPFTLDHLTLAGRSLEAMSDPFTRLGLRPDYGGPHENGVTHMAMLGFDDGTYLEFIAPIDPDAVSPIWHDFSSRDAGPAAWCVTSEDAAREADRLRRLDIPVRGPAARGRRRPDGVALKWSLAFVGEGSPGAFHPFLIEDATPRGDRVGVTPSTGAAGLTGIEAVILCVADLTDAIRVFRKAYDLPPAIPVSLPGLDATVVAFPGEPLLLAEPRDAASPLGKRLAMVGDAPCGLIIGSRDLDLTVASLKLAGTDAGKDSLLPLPFSVGPGAFAAIVPSGRFRNAQKTPASPE